MPATYEKIQSTTLGSAASDITFSSIPGTYTDLKIILVPASGTVDANLFMRFNSDTGSNYSNTRLTGNGSAASSASQVSQTSLTTGAITTGVVSYFSQDVFSYSGSTYKTVLFEQNQDANGSGQVNKRVGLWRSTSAITTILFTTPTANGFPAGTTATIYGILKA